MHRGDKVLRRNGSGASYTLGVILAVFGRRDGSIWCTGETDEGNLFHGELSEFSLIQENSIKAERYSQPTCNTTFKDWE